MRFFSALAVVLAALIVSAVSAADPVNVEITAVEEQPGRLVVTVGAYDAEARPLTDLTAASFRASLDGRSLPISDVQTSKTPRSAAFVVLVVETSGSMAGEPMNQAKRALQEFVRGLDPVDQAAIIAFDAQVTLVQDFTSDRALLDQAIGRLAPLGDTALYSGVLEALAKASAAPGSRRLIVLLSDGQATTGLALRSDSIDAARNGGIGIVAVGLGSGIDGAYLNELTAASGGRFLEAPTPASLREAYADLAVAIRSQYTLVLQVPSGIDRSVPAELLVQASLRADSGKAVREIPPLAGALPPPFLVSLLGITAGQRTEERLSVTPKTPPGVSLVGVEYFLDNDLVVRTTQPPFAYELDPTAIAEGPHILKVVATDARGRLGETQLSFIAALAVPASEPARPEPQTLLVMAGGVVVLGGIIYVFFRRLRSRSKNAVASRVRPWAVRTAEPLPPVEGWPSPPPPPQTPTAS